MPSELVKIVLDRFRDDDGRPTCEHESGCVWLCESPHGTPWCGYLGPDLCTDGERIVPHDDCPFWVDDVEVM